MRSLPVATQICYEVVSVHYVGDVSSHVFLAYSLLARTLQRAQHINEVCTHAKVRRHGLGRFLCSYLFLLSVSYTVLYGMSTLLEKILVGETGMARDIQYKTVKR